MKKLLVVIDYQNDFVNGALGLEDKVSKVLRISLNKDTTEEDISQLIKILREEL